MSGAAHRRFTPRPRNRAQLPIPRERFDALERLLIDHPNFDDDGCSSSPDRWFGFDFRWACRLHDAAYCTRANPPGSMTAGAKIAADWQLGRDVADSLPWRWRWVGPIYRTATLRVAWRAFDSCGRHDPYGATTTQRSQDLCRHGLALPEWMITHPLRVA